MISEHISTAAIRLLKFTIEGPLGCMQPAGNSANAERSGSHNLLPRSMFHFVEIKRQIGPSCTNGNNFVFRINLELTFIYEIL